MSNLINRFLFHVQNAFHPELPQPRKVTIARPHWGTTDISRWAKRITETPNCEWDIITTPNQTLYIIYT